MEGKLQKSIRNSECLVPKNKREFLTYENIGLMNCTLEETEDRVIFTFDTLGYEEGSTVLKKPKEEGLRFLKNCASLLPLYEEYDFSLSLSNLLVDDNLMPKILVRDGRNHESNEFLTGYKALIGSVLLPRYKYEDFLEGKDLYKKNKLLQSLYELPSVTQIVEVLEKEYEKVVKQKVQTKQLVPKRNILMTRIVLPILIIVLGVSGFFLQQAYLEKIPYSTDMIAARDAYIDNNPLLVQYLLRGYEIEEMSHETRYILARSYVVTEVLTSDQIESILLNLTLRTDGMLYDYWIHMGRLEFEEALHIAGRFNDNELLLFAYLKYQAVAINDLNMGGDDRPDLLNRLDSRITSLLSEREETLELMLEEGDD